MVQRNTVQRSLVLSAVRKLRSHATAEEIYDEIVKTHPNVSRATVYRNLNKLVQQGEIGKIEISGEPDCFDHMNARHYHVKCVRCQKIFDVDMDYISGLEDNIKNRNGFDILGHEVLFMGICPDCKNATDSGNKPE
ncbi:MAG: Fur family transcriptional regulator [Christensenellales bacterium]